MDQAWSDYFDASRGRDLVTAFDAMLALGVKPVPLTYDDNGNIKKPIGEKWGQIPIDQRRKLLADRIESDPQSAGIGCQPFGYVVFDLDPPDKDPNRVGEIYDDFIQIVMGGEEHLTTIVRGAGGLHIWFKSTKSFEAAFGDRAKRRVPMPCGGQVEIFTGSEKYQAQVACPPSEGKRFVKEVSPAILPEVVSRFIMSTQRETLSKQACEPSPLPATFDSWEAAYFSNRTSKLLARIAQAPAGSLHYTLRDMLLVIAGYASGMGCMPMREAVDQGIIEALEMNGNCRSFDGARKTMEWSWAVGSSMPLKAEGYDQNKGSTVTNDTQGSYPPVAVGVVATASDGVQITPYTDPFHVARRFIDHEGERRLVTWKGASYQWQKGRYVEIKPDEIRAKSGSFTDHYYLINAENELAHIDDPNKRAAFKKKPVTSGVIQSVTQAFLSVSTIEESRLRSMPGWIDRQQSDWNPIETIALANCLLNVRTGESKALTNRWFSRCRSNVTWNGGVIDCPTWLQFLGTVFPDDPNSIRLLQQFMGLCLTSDTSFQKMLSLVGPPRSGKGTTVRVLQRLLGVDAVVSLGMGDLAREFGLEKLVGAQLAIMPDVRFGGRENVSDAIERLLSITGEDDIRIARKYQADWNGKLPTRIVLASNEMPRLPDAAAALPTRMLTLHFTESFVGREDAELMGRLEAELEGILAWAVKGYMDLIESGRFIENDATVNACDEAREIGSPMVAFMRDCLIVSHNQDTSVEMSEVYRVYQGWCNLTGHKASSMTTMIKQIMDLEPKIRKARPGNRSATRRRSLVGVQISTEGMSVRIDRF
jgi:putative DNA primase/helicase